VGTGVGSGVGDGIGTEVGFGVVGSGEGLRVMVGILEVVGEADG
jgi:hypothetical protein